MERECGHAADGDALPLISIQLSQPPVTQSPLALTLMDHCNPHGVGGLSFPLESSQTDNVQIQCVEMVYKNRRENVRGRCYVGTDVK